MTFGSRSISSPKLTVSRCLYSKLTMAHGIQSKLQLNNSRCHLTSGRRLYASIKLCFGLVYIKCSASLKNSQVGCMKRYNEQNISVYHLSRTSDCQLFLLNVTFQSPVTLAIIENEQVGTCLDVVWRRFALDIQFRFLCHSVI